MLDKKIRDASLTASLTEKDIAKIKEASSDRQKSLRNELEALRSRQSKTIADEAKALSELEKARALKEAEADVIANKLLKDMVTIDKDSKTDVSNISNQIIKLKTKNINLKLKTKN